MYEQNSLIIPVDCNMFNWTEGWLYTNWDLNKLCQSDAQYKLILNNIFKNAHMFQKSVKFKVVPRLWIFEAKNLPQKLRV